MGASNSFSISNNWLQITVLSLVILFSGYSVIVMYASGEYAFALLTLFLVAVGVYVFTNSKAYAHRYIFPGVASMGVFIIFPLIYTIGISFTNYSGTNLLSLERVQAYHLSQNYMAEAGRYKFSLYDVGDGKFRFGLQSENDADLIYVSSSTELWDRAEIKSRKARPEDLVKKIQMRPAESLLDEPVAAIKTIIGMRTHLQALDLVLQDGTELKMAGLRKFAALKPRHLLTD